MENVWLSGPVVSGGCFDYYTPTQHTLQGYSCRVFSPLESWSLRKPVSAPTPLFSAIPVFFLIPITNQVQPFVEASNVRPSLPD